VIRISRSPKKIGTPLSGWFLKFLSSHPSPSCAARTSPLFSVVVITAPPLKSGIKRPPCHLSNSALPSPEWSFPSIGLSLRRGIGSPSFLCAFNMFSFFCGGIEEDEENIVSPLLAFFLQEVFPFSLPNSPPPPFSFSPNVFAFFFPQRIEALAPHPLGVASFPGTTPIQNLLFTFRADGPPFP